MGGIFGKKTYGGGSKKGKMTLHAICNIFPYYYMLRNMS